jgi:uncharacterized Zn-binding protein involved in type VI secretion
VGSPAANGQTVVTATDVHVVLVPSPGGPVPTPLPHPFLGRMVSALAPTVTVGGDPAATVGSVAQNQPAHLPTPPGASFQTPPSNRATVRVGSATVLVAGNPAARVGDLVETCNDPTDLPAGTVAVAHPTVMVG